jgi:hypothetical protein
VSRHNDNAEDAFHLLQSGQNSLLQIPLETGFNQVWQHFSICSGAEAMARSSEAAPQFAVVFDDAVMHNDEVSSAIAVRMRILFARRAVCRPTRVSYGTHRSIYDDRPGLKLFLESTNTAN